MVAAARPVAAVTFDGAELVEAPAAILDRMNYESAELTDQVLDDLEADLNETAGRYEEAGSTVLAPQIVRQRLWAHRLL